MIPAGQHRQVKELVFGAGGYLLTDLGAALGPALGSLDAWARRWSAALAETVPSGQ